MPNFLRQVKNKHSFSRNLFLKPGIKSKLGFQYKYTVFLVLPFHWLDSCIMTDFRKSLLVKWIWPAYNETQVWVKGKFSCRTTGDEKVFILSKDSQIENLKTVFEFVFVFLQWNQNFRSFSHLHNKYIGFGYRLLTNHRLKATTLIIITFYNFCCKFLLKIPTFAFLIVMKHWIMQIKVERLKNVMYWFGTAGYTAQYIASTRDLKTVIVHRNETWGASWTTTYKVDNFPG